MNNKEDKEFVMPNGFKITGNINYYTKRKLEGMRAILLGAIYTMVEQRRFTLAKDGKWARMLVQEGASYGIVNL